MFDALVIDPRDNVATALRPLGVGSVETNRGSYITREPIPSGHKFALEDMAAHAFLRKYGEVIGVMTVDTLQGDHVHVHNVGDIIGRSEGAEGRAAAAGLVTKVPRKPPRLGPWKPNDLAARTFMGYRRPDGQVGIRNYVLVISTVGCANVVAERIAAKTDSPVITHQQGCLQLGIDMELTKRQLIGAARNPNVAGVLLVSLGCEFMQPNFIIKELNGKPITVVGIQNEGGTRSAVERDCVLVKELQEEVS